jgi:hypothetical protein
MGVVSAGRRRRIPAVLNAVVTEIPPKLEPVTEDSFEYVAATDRPSEALAARLAQLFGSEPRRAIVD